MMTRGADSIGADGGASGADLEYKSFSEMNQFELTQIMGDTRYSSGVRGAAAAEFIKRNFMLVENKAASGVQGLIKSVKNAMKAEEAIKTSQGIIKDFNMDFLLKEKEIHVFSADHIKNGIMDLGKNREGIMKSGFDILEEMNEKGLLKEGPTQIRTTINGFKSEIRIYIKDGKLINFDMFKGQSTRDMGNTITYP